MTTEPQTARKNWMVLDGTKANDRDGWGPMTQEAAETMVREGKANGRHYMALPWANTEEGRLWTARQARLAEQAATTATSPS